MVKQHKYLSYSWITCIVAKVGLALCILVTNGSAQGAGTLGVTVQVDGSGSMAGFHQTDELSRLIDQIATACGNANLSCDVQFFVTEQSQQMTWKSQTAFFQGDWGYYTNLEQAFVTGLGQSPIKVLLTDNVHNVVVSQDTRALYARFAQDTVKVLHAIPLLRPFSGPLFNPFSRQPDGLAKLQSLNSRAVIQTMDSGDHVYYEGERGLILYLYLTDRKMRPSYDRLLNILKAVGEPILLKPIDEAIILQATSFGKTEAPLHQPTRISFNFTLKSTLSHIDIVAGDSGGPEVSLNVQPPRVWSQDRIFFGSPLSRGMVTPPRLMETLRSGAQSSYVYRCEVLLGPFHPSYRNVFEYLGMARLQSIPANYVFSISMDIPPDAFQMTDSYKERYFTENLGIFNRIYTPKGADIIRSLHTRTLRVSPRGGEVADQFAVKPPRGPLIALGLLILSGGILGMVVLRQVRYPLCYRLTDSAKQESEYEERFVGPWSRRPALTHRQADGTELYFGHFMRRLRHLHTFMFIPEEGVRVEDEYGECLVPRPASEREETASPDGVTERSACEVVLKKGKKFVLKHGETKLTLEQIDKLSENFGA